VPTTEVVLVIGINRHEGSLTWNVAVIMACEATTAAKIAMTKEGINQPGGTALKKGFEYAAGLTLI